jgi:hypothetical protein
LLLLIALVLGVILAVMTGLQRSSREAEFRRLAKEIGDLTIEDGSKVHVLALETGEPLDFAWRVYVPTDFSTRIGFGGQMFDSGYSGNQDPVDFIVRARFRKSADGSLDIFVKEGDGSMRPNYVNKEVAALIRDHPEWVRVEQLGKDGIAVVDPKRNVLLLQLRMSPEMEAEARKTIPPDELKNYIDDLFDIILSVKVNP